MIVCSRAHNLTKRMTCGIDPSSVIRYLRCRKEEIALVPFSLLRLVVSLFFT